MLDLQGLIDFTTEKLNLKDMGKNEECIKQVERFSKALCKAANVQSRFNKVYKDIKEERKHHDRRTEARK